MTPRERFEATLAGQPRDRVPVTPLFMRWAAEHRGHTYRQYYLQPEVLSACQVAVARDLGTDAVSVISDPWTEADGFGVALDYPDDGTGKPRQPLVHAPSEVLDLRPLDLDRGRPAARLRAVQLEAQALGATHPVIGWIEGPLASYCNLRGLEAAMTDLLDDPSGFAAAAEFLVAEGARFAITQLDRGADLIGIGDAAASIIGPDLYRDHVQPWEARLIGAIHDAGGRVKLHICGNTTPLLADMARTGADLIDVDWMVPLDHARSIVGEEVVLCGNFDPAAVLRRGTPLDVRNAAAKCIATGGDRFILQPGCEVPSGTPMVNLRAFCPCSQ